MAVRNLKSVLKSLEKFGKEADLLVAESTTQAANEIAAEAKRLAPVNKKVGKGGYLRNQIRTHEVNPLSYEVVAAAPYSAYMEFGTGGLVNVPTELQEMAIKFKGNGIKQINLHPQPFLYPALLKGRVHYLDDLTDNLNDLTKKYN